MYFEDGRVRNSTFEQGDWNGDAEFDSRDLIYAFQAGTYEVAEEPAESQIAAAVDWLLVRDEDRKRGRAFVS